MNRPGKFVPKRGRPTAEQSSAIEETILNTARTLFIDKGLDLMAMETIANEAGVSKGTLYSRYPSKEHLFEAVVRRSIEHWSADASKGDADAGDDIGDRLRHHARTLLTFTARPDVAAINQLVQGNSTRFPLLAKVMHEAGYLSLRNTIARDIEAAADRDGIAVSDPQSVAEQLICGLTGWYSQHSPLPHYDQDSASAVIGRMVDLLLSARSAW